MARINFEEYWFNDPRREALIVRIGIVADAVALRMWKLAQGFFKDGSLVPADLYEHIPHWQDFEAVGLAERRLDGIYIKGRNKHFAWLLDKLEAASQGGKNSAKRRRDSKGRLLPTNSKQSPSTVQAESKCSQASSSLSFSYSHSLKEEEEGKTTKSAVALPQLAILWNLNSGTLPKVRACADTRRRQAEARWREHPEEDYWIEIIRRMARSTFCNGENKQSWRADFDFLLQPETQNKVLEGKYDDRISRADVQAEEYRRIAAECDRQQAEINRNLEVRLAV